MGNSQPHPMDAYATTAQIAARWGVSEERVCQLAPRTEGARKIGRDWIIPVDAKKPAELPWAGRSCRGRPAVDNLHPVFASILRRFIRPTAPRDPVIEAWLERYIRPQDRDRVRPTLVRGECGVVVKKRLDGKAGGV